MRQIPEANGGRNVKKHKIKILLGLVLILIILTGGFMLYASVFYHANDQANKVLQAGLKEQSIEVDHDLTVFGERDHNDVGFIFYPGAKVEAIAYVPFLNELSKHGITCILVDMPLHMAIFNSSAAKNIQEQYPDIKTWYIGGHSMGGAMASKYVAEHKSEMKGLILLGAYLYGDVDASKSLTLYGSEDQVINREKIDYSTNVHQIKGGNHAGFGNYGKQKGDGEATISSEAQQSIAIDYILDFMGKNTKDN